MEATSKFGFQFHKKLICLVEYFVFELKGWDREEELMLELKAWQMARKKVGKRIRKQVWDDMEVKGMSIKVRSKIWSGFEFPAKANFKVPKPVQAS